MLLEIKHSVILLIGILTLFISCVNSDNKNPSNNDQVEHENSIDTIQTISSLKKHADNLYELTVYGDYSVHMKKVNHEFITELKEFKYHCSLFSIMGDSSQYYFGRSFDNGGTPNTKHYTLVVRCNPPDGYSSISLVRMADIGFWRDTTYEDRTNYERVTDVGSFMKSTPDNSSYTEKLKLLDAPYYTPDGINEKGLVVSLANYYPAEKYNIDSLKDTISYNYLVRRILDNCKNVDEAIEIIRSQNVVFYSGGNDHFSSTEVHLMVADPYGNSIIAEVHDGIFEFTRPEDPWQIATNSRTFGLAEEIKKNRCFRYDTLQTRLEKENGKLNRKESLTLLKAVGFTFTQWSALYDITNKKVILSLEYDFENTYEFDFKEQ